MQLTFLDYLAVTGAAGAAGAINAVAGGGSLVSFPTLVGLGVPAVTANVTNTIGLLPGYVAGSWAQRDDLRPQVEGARLVAAFAVAGGLAGSILLVALPGRAFRDAVPYLILVSCLLLLGQDRLRDQLRSAGPRATGVALNDDADAAPTADSPVTAAPTTSTSPILLGAVFVAAVYGGFFGAGLGIVLLAVLGLFSAESLIRLNALKQALSFLINLVAAAFFAGFGHARWELVPVMAAASVIGGAFGGRFVQFIDPVQLRRTVVVAGVGVAIAFWVGSTVADRRPPRAAQPEPRAISLRCWKR